MRNSPKPQTDCLRKLRSNPRSRRPLRAGRPARRAAGLIALALLPFIAAAGPLGGQWPQPVEAIETALYRFELAEAYSLAAAHPNAQVRLLYQTHARFLQQLVGPSCVHAAAYTRTADSAHRLLESSPQSEFKHLIQAELALQAAVLGLLEGETWLAAWQIRRCWNHVQALKSSKHPAPARLRGLFEVCLAAVPDRYQWVLDFLGLSGSLTRGTAELIRSAQANTFFSQQSKVLLLYTYRHLHAKPTRAWEQAQKEQQAGRSPILWNYLLAQLEIENLNGAAAQKLIREIEGEAHRLPFIWWLSARISMGRSDFAAAEEALARFEKHYGGRLYQHDCGMRRAALARLKGDRQGFQQQVKQTLGLPEPLIDEDRNALKEVKAWERAAQSPQHQLWLQLKMALDGGWAESARATLSQLQKFQLNADERTEWNYRKARLEHKLGRIDQALTCYRESRKYPAKTNTWMQVASLLHEGIIHEQLSQYRSAKKYYTQVFDYSNYSYQSSIEQKARAGLLRVQLALSAHEP